MRIGQEYIKTNNSVELLGLELDDRLKFESYVNKICTRAGGQLNSLFRFHKYLTPFTKKLLVNSFIFQILAIALYHGIFVQQNHETKLNKYKKELINF